MVIGTPVVREEKLRERLERLTVVGSGVAELARNRAEEILKEVRASDFGEQMSSLVRDLVERTEQNRREIVTLVRAEIRSQMTSLGLATERDLERLERRIARLEERAAAAAATTKTTKSPQRKAPARRRAAPRPKPDGEGEDLRKESRADRDLARQASRRSQAGQEGASRDAPTGAQGGAAEGQDSAEGGERGSTGTAGESEGGTR